jgi:hypothetical protein
MRSAVISCERSNPAPFPMDPLLITQMELFGSRLARTINPLNSTQRVEFNRIIARFRSRVSLLRRLL